jgi:hypothetical protein
MTKAEKEQQISKLLEKSKEVVIQHCKDSIFNNWKFINLQPNTINANLF